MQRPLRRRRRRRLTSAAAPSPQRRARLGVILWLTLVCGFAMERTLGQGDIPPQVDINPGGTEIIRASPITAAPSTSAPTTVEAPVTEVPTEAPIAKPLQPQPQTTTSPAPVLPVEPQRTTVQGITAVFGQAGAIPADQYETFQQIVSEWFNNYYNNNNNNNNAAATNDGNRQKQFRFRRQLQSNDIFLTVRNMDSTMDITKQAVDGSTNAVTYSQTLEYNAVTAEAPPNAETLVLEPWKDEAYTEELAIALAEELPQAFANVVSPLSTPIIISTTTPTDGPVTSNNDDSSWSLGAIIGIAVGGVVVLLGAVWFMWRFCGGGSGENSKSPQGRDVPYHDAGNRSQVEAQQDQSPPSVAGVMVYDEPGEALASHTVVARAVLLASDNNPTPLLAKSSPSQAELQEDATPKPTPMAVPSRSEDGYAVQYKDQVRSASPYDT